mmetsp:Transcript_98536/g.284315  ORF Transcript_98536/g.284315 Transcript_98536/m.284315 type:complete len:389 (-) Transcript_98536:1535-2701(-)
MASPSSLRDGHIDRACIWHDTLAEIYVLVDIVDRAAPEPIHQNDHKHPKHTTGGVALPDAGEAHDALVAKSIDDPPVSDSNEPACDSVHNQTDRLQQVRVDQVLQPCGDARARLAHHGVQSGHRLIDASVEFLDVLHELLQVARLLLALPLAIRSHARARVCRLPSGRILRGHHVERVAIADAVSRVNEDIAPEVREVENLLLQPDKPVPCLASLHVRRALCEVAHHGIRAIGPDAGGGAVRPQRGDEALHTSDRLASHGGHVGTDNAIGATHRRRKGRGQRLSGEECLVIVVVLPTVAFINHHQHIDGVLPQHGGQLDDLRVLGNLRGVAIHLIVDVFELGVDLVLDLAHDRLPHRHLSAVLRQLDDVQQRGVGTGIRGDEALVDDV